MKKKTDPLLCTGFGPHRAKCPYRPMRTRTKLWCARCDRLRRDHLTKQLERIERAFRDPDAE